jgi:aspartyl-tRNA synthetase
MSFATQEDVFEVGQKVFYDVFKEFGHKEVSPIPFRRIQFREAMEKYGSDKPDLRIHFEIENLTNLLSKNDSVVFKDKEVKAMKVESSDKSNSWYKKLEEEYKGLGATSLGFIKYENKEISGSMAKLFSDAEKAEITKLFSLTDGNVVFISPPVAWFEVTDSAFMYNASLKLHGTCTPDNTGTELRTEITATIGLAKGIYFLLLYIVGIRHDACLVET